MRSGLGLAPLPQEVPEPGSLESPLPGGVAAVVRFFLDFPQPLQIAGLIVGALLFLAGAILLWRYRRQAWRWLTTRPRIVYASAAGVGVVLLLAGAWMGIAGWHYVQHDNGFCTGCHVMGPAFVRFTQSEHSELQCHDCHQQSVFASMRQLYLWVAERPEEIGEHSPVPIGVCAACHVGDDPTSNETWERIASTQGHELHLRSDDPDLADVQCVTCHAPEVHRFAPAEATCGQSGCHSPEETSVELGAMAAVQTSLHCVGCHRFAAPMAAETSALMPGLEECGGCHEMRELITDFVPATDPHDAVCGLCHNPHDQPDPEAAVETCTSAGCHSDPESLTPFHRGLNHATVEGCTTCHEAHGFVVDGDDCRGCHRNLSE
jgi:hypothetical protein